MAYNIKHTAEQIDALLGEVFDSTLQDKTIEITQSGTTEIVADEDYLALKKVNVNVNVQGGSGGNGGGDEWRYYILNFADIHKEEGYSKSKAMQIMHALEIYYNTQYIVDWSSKFVLGGLMILSFDTENWNLLNYLAMRWTTAKDLSAFVGLNLSPKELLNMYAADMPFAAKIASRMTECTKDEFNALAQ